MMRDFSPGAKELLMQYVDDVIASGVWETIENGKGEFNQAGQDWLSKLGISDYLDNMEGYYQNIISKHSTTKEEIEQIFSDVQQVDTRYIGTVAGLQLFYLATVLACAGRIDCRPPKRESVVAANPLPISFPVLSFQWCC